MKIKSFKPKNFKPKQGNKEGQYVESRYNQPVEPGRQIEENGQKKIQYPGGGGSLKLIPLGGVGLVQKNMFVYEFGNDILVIDCGVSFPDEGMPGVDLVIPDISYLKERRDKIRAIIITHGHDDHIGGLPYIWPELKVPIYSQKLTCGFIKNKFSEHKLPIDVIKPLNINDTLRLGVFGVSFYQASHSVPDTTGIVLSTPVGTIVHQSDFKVDWTPVNGQVTDVAKAARIGDAGVTLLTIDCLRADKPGYNLSEKTIEPTFLDIAEKTKGKLLITLMTSNITRIQQAVNVAVKTNRKISFVGRSMENNFQVSRELGYLDIPANLVIPQEEIKRFGDDKVLIVIAGSLGQEGSALDRVANNDHKYIRVKKGDTIVFSSDPMPSAEVSQAVLIDNLTRLGCNVIASAFTADLHVSGHAAAEELKLMVNLIRPKFLMPMGGEYRHMKTFEKLALELGYKEEQIIIPNEGDILEIKPTQIKINGFVETQQVYVDGLGVGDVGNIILRDRQVMAEEGVVVVIVPLDKSGHLSGEPDVISRGFVFGDDAVDMLGAAKEIVKSCLREKKEGPLDWKYARREIEKNLEKFFYGEIKRNPLVLPVVVEI